MVETTRSREPDKFIVRFPEGWRDLLAKRAKENGRSMNSELLQILKPALSDQQAA